MTAATFAVRAEQPQPQSPTAAELQQQAARDYQAQQEAAQQNGNRDDVHMGYGR